MAASAGVAVGRAGHWGERPQRASSRKSKTDRVAALLESSVTPACGRNFKEISMTMLTIAAFADPTNPNYPSKTGNPSGGGRGNQKK